ncbi:MAG: sugar ABC transporter ATP-binding protein [Planctomycetota bacterium]
MSAPLLQARGIEKRFPGVRALHQVDLHVEPGEVLGLVGENGAGKSTLMKILAGIQSPDAGELRWSGETVHLPSPRAASALGIALIHQELNLADNLDVAANLFLGREPHRFGLIDRSTIERESEKVLERIGVSFGPRTPIADLSVGQRQLVEIARALAADARLLIMDEPTSSLSTHESERLFEVIVDLRQKGVSIVYISHRLGEVMDLADRVSVLRDGENAGELQREEITRERMISLMVGRELDSFYASRPHALGDVVLEVEGLRTGMYPEHSASLRVRAGERVGLAGLVGAGRTELLRALFGIDPALSGRMRVGGVDVPLGSPRHAIAAGLALVPEDRQAQGLVLGSNIRDNVGLASLDRRRRVGLVSHPAEDALARRLMGSLRIKASSTDQLVATLSGGNQQKVALAKWLALEPRVLLLDEPTRGVDVGAKHEIYETIARLAESGLAVLFVSSEMEEVLGLADRVLVMHEGRITGELQRDELEEKAVLRLATGGTEAASR